MVNDNYILLNNKGGFMTCIQCRYFFKDKIVTAPGTAPYCKDHVMEPDEFYCQFDNMVFPDDLQMTDSDCDGFDPKESAEEEE
jgi:hypothetical protein